MAERKKALFLDRDGVINTEKGYVHKIEEFEFVDGVFECCATGMRLGYTLIVITNQAGIGRGYYTEKDYHILTEWMLARFAERGVHIAKIYHCPYHPVHGTGAYKKDSFWRKPNPGMILQARDDFGLDLPASVLVGDKESDIEAGLRAGVGANVLLCSGRCLIPDRLKTDVVLGSLEDVGRWMKSREGQ